MDVKDIDLGWNKIIQELQELKDKEVAVGIQADEVNSDGKNLAYIGAVHEFGKDIEVTDKMRSYLHAQGLHLKKTTKVIKIPQRSFLREAIDENESEINSLEDKLLDQVIAGRISSKQALESIGNTVQGLVQQRIADGIQPGLHPFTIQQKTVHGKKGTTPLIGSGHLRQSIRYKIRTRGSSDE